MGLAMLAAATPQANAGFVLVWEPNQSRTIGTISVWGYSAFFTTSVDPGTGQPVETLLPGSYVTVYDFGGYVPGSMKINSKEFKLTEQNTASLRKASWCPIRRRCPTLPPPTPGRL